MGTTLLFWGAMTGRPVVGLVCALLVEAKSWMRLRWDFSEEAYERSWQLTVAMIIVGGLFIWLDESRYTAVLVLLGWMPPLLLPMQFAQSYGMQPSIPMTAMSLIARRSRERNRRLGLITSPVCFNFGNVTFVVTLISAAVGLEGESHFFLPGVVILCGWRLWTMKRCRLSSLIPVLIVTGLMGIAGERGLQVLEQWVRAGGTEEKVGFNPNFHNTLIGKQGMVIQSPEIMWRLRVPPGRQAPPRLRTATYNNFLALSWQNQRRDFKNVKPTVIGQETFHVLDARSSVADDTRLPEFLIRGTVDDTFPLPVPADPVRLSGLKTSRVEANPLGSVRVEPAEPVVNATVVWGGGSSIETAAEEADLRGLAKTDADMIRRVVEEIGLREIQPLEDRLKYLSRWFNKNFRYSMDLKIRQPTARELLGGGKRPPSAIEQFLTTVREGHCEYFATAACLMLRETGVPTRYATGYSVMEINSGSGEYLIRGTHAHAWCRVWDESRQRWLDFDPTPGDGVSTRIVQTPWMQRLKDGIKRAREDFFLWRNNPDNEWVVVAVLSVLGTALSAFIFFRLWRSRRR
ncbi:MAG TPA: transglutaminase-like domain-containing protein, partial [Luteolibacter sp.]|nr:transglutaminase-like domain-containing protein [Luteolibacter sp.]